MYNVIDWARLLLAKLGGILFASRCDVGLGMLLLGFLAPVPVLCGILTLLGIVVVSRLFSIPIAARPDGLHYFNAFLVGLGVGVYGLPGWSLPLACLLAACMNLLLCEILDQWFYAGLGLPALSLPFVLVTWTLLRVHERTTFQDGLLVHPPQVYPEVIHPFFVDMGTILFMPS